MTKVAVKLAHHYTDSGKNYAPGDEIKVDAQTAKSLAAGGYVVGTADAASITPALKTPAPRRGRTRKTAPAKTTATAQGNADAGGATS